MGIEDCGRFDSMHIISDRFYDRCLGVIDNIQLSLVILAKGIIKRELEPGQSEELRKKTLQYKEWFWYVYFFFIEHTLIFI